MVLFRLKISRLFDIDVWSLCSYILLRSLECVLATIEIECQLAFYLLFRCIRICLWSER